jgi:Zn-dependent protease
MLIQLLFSSPLQFLTIAIALILALSFHEAAHAWVSYKLGDDTALEMGRLTLNPLAHIDPVGAMLLLLVGFGWGKPVMVNPRNFKNPIRDEILTSLAGPASNLLLTVIVAVIYTLSKPFASSALQSLLLCMGFYNIILMLFNLIPIPPLDGSKILYLFLPFNAIEFFNRYSFYILLLIIFVPIGGITLIDLIISKPSLYLIQLLFRTNPFL